MSAILGILSELRPEFDFSASENFLEDGMLDSFDIVMLVSQLDQTYSISILGTDVLPENFQNLKSIERLLEKYNVKS